MKETERRIAEAVQALVEGAKVGMVNNNDVKEQEVLSSNVYLYSIDNDEISIA